MKWKNISLIAYPNIYIGSPLAMREPIFFADALYFSYLQNRVCSVEWNEENILLIAYPDISDKALSGEGESWFFYFYWIFPFYIFTKYCIYCKIKDEKTSFFIAHPIHLGYSPSCAEGDFFCALLFYIFTNCWIYCKIHIGIVLDNFFSP